jgi:hypothetical protein
VTRSDLAVWREHLEFARQPSRFVVLNKIDTLADPLSLRRRIVAAADRSSSATPRRARWASSRSGCSRCRRVTR